MIFNTVMAFTCVLIFFGLAFFSDVPKEVITLFPLTGLILTGIAVAIGEIKK